MGVDFAGSTASQTEVGPTPRGAGRSGGGSVELEKRWQRRALTRLISASLLSCRALSKPKAFPPGGDKEAAGEAGGGSLSGPRALGPRPLPRAADPTEHPARTGGGRGPPGAGRGSGRGARASRPGGGAGQGRGPAGGPRCLPWNLLLSATDMVSTRLPPAQGFAAANEGRGGGAGAWSEIARRVAAGPRGGGMARAAGHSPPPSLPARPAPLRFPSPPLPAAGIKAAIMRDAEPAGRPLCWRTRKMHRAEAARERLPLASSLGPLPVRSRSGRGFPLNRRGRP